MCFGRIGFGGWFGWLDDGKVAEVIGHSFPTGGERSLGGGHHALICGFNDVVIPVTNINVFEGRVTVTKGIFFGFQGCRDGIGVWQDVLTGRAGGGLVWKIGFRVSVRMG